MSAILDALRKAQEERKRFTPGIPRGTGMFSSGSRKTIYIVAAALVVVGVALFIGVGTFRQKAQPAPPVSGVKEDKPGLQTGQLVPKPPAPVVTATAGEPPVKAGAAMRGPVSEKGAPGRRVLSGSTASPILQEGEERRGKVRSAGEKVRSAYSSPRAGKIASPEQQGDGVRVAARKTDETEITSMYNSALREGDKGNLVEAKRLYLAILAERPGHIEALNNLGVVAMKEGNGKEALFYFRKVLEINKKYGKAYNNIGLVLLKEGDKRQAEWNFRKAIEMGQDSVEPYLNLAALYRSDRRLGDAAQLLEILLSKGERSPAVHLSYAIIKDEMGQPAEAIAHYRYYLREVGSSGGTNPVVERLKTLEIAHPRNDR